MSKILDLVMQGGPVMVPLIGLSVATLSCALERAWFWIRLLSHEKQIVKDVLQAAHQDLYEAATIAGYAKISPIGRFLQAPLQLSQPTPETFHLALEASADKEFVKMRKGDKLFETVVAVAPLLGLLGTVTGLITTFSNLQIGSDCCDYCAHIFSDFCCASGAANGLLYGSGQRVRANLSASVV
jgi:biopolymer transport protein ExbB